MSEKLGKVQLFLEKYHPDTMLANRTVQFFNDNAMMNFRKMLQPRQRRLTLDMFLAKNGRKATAEEEESTGSKSHRREKTPKGEIPSFLLRGTPPRKGM